MTGNLRQGDIFFLQARLFGMVYQNPYRFLHFFETLNDSKIKLILNDNTWYGIQDSWEGLDMYMCKIHMVIICIFWKRKSMARLSVPPCEIFIYSYYNSLCIKWCTAFSQQLAELQQENDSKCHWWFKSAGFSLVRLKYYLYQFFFFFSPSITFEPAVVPPPPPPSKKSLRNWIGL